jgi:hypothetical protein
MPLERGDVNFDPENMLTGNQQNLAIREAIVTLVIEQAPVGAVEATVV